MNRRAQREAIYKACGWMPEHIRSGAMYYVPRIDTHVGDPLSDLNAMHEAEKTRVMDESSVTYLEWLARLSCPWCATAAQRAEAFLRTLGLWEGEQR
jgi:hypothetical protein